MTAVTEPAPLSLADVRVLDRYWRAVNYLAVGQIYLMDNPLLAGPLLPEHIKPRLLGHWGTTPGLNFIWAHLSRAITVHDVPMMIVVGPGHGGPAALANTWLEGSYTDVYPGVQRDAAGMRQLFRQFSFPGGVPSHVSPRDAGIDSRGRRARLLAVARARRGVRQPGPDRGVRRRRRRGRDRPAGRPAGTRTGSSTRPATAPSCRSCTSTAGRSLIRRCWPGCPSGELDALLRGYGYEPAYVTSDGSHVPHLEMAATLDAAIARIRSIQDQARTGAHRPGQLEPGEPHGQRWPMIVLRTPKGWTGPAEVDGLPVEGTWRAHQVPLAEVRTNPAHLRQLEDWMRSYRPEELFGADGRPARRPASRSCRPVRSGSGRRRTPTAASCCGTWTCPDSATTRCRSPRLARSVSEPTRVLGVMLRDVLERNAEQRNFRVFGPDETESNRLGAVLEVTGKTWEEATLPVDVNLAPDGRVMEILSEHTCQGWLEGYLLTGRHGLFSCYEAFIHIVDSMFNQHAKWLKVARHLPWRRPVASLNILLTSHVWRQDHNGFSHQDPGFIDHVVNKKAEVIRVYLPPDTNTLLSVADHCLRSRDYVNVIVAGKQPNPDWLDMDAAVLHCTRGAGHLGVGQQRPRRHRTRRRARLRRRRAHPGDPGRHRHPPPRAARPARPRRQRRRPDAAPAGDRAPARHERRRVQRAVPAEPAGDLRLPRLPVADPPADLPPRRARRRSTSAATRKRAPPPRPFDMVVMNDMDRFHLVMDVIDRVPGLAERAGQLRQRMVDTLVQAPRLDPGARRGPARGPQLDLVCIAVMTRVLVVNAGSSSLKVTRARRR